MSSTFVNRRAVDFNYPGEIKGDIVFAFPSILKTRPKPNKYGHYKKNSWTIYVGLCKIDSGKDISAGLNNNPLIKETREFTDSDLVDLFSVSYKIDNSIWDKLIIDYYAFYVVDSHMVGNAHKFNMTKVYKKGKNIGRANATNPFTQAMSDAFSEYNKKLGTTNCYKPMLASGEAVLNGDPEEIKKLITNEMIKTGLYMQYKYDGIRCCHDLYNRDNPSTYSRNCKEIILGKDMKEELELISSKLKVRNAKVILDGELYNHDFDLNQISGIVRASVGAANIDKKDLLFYFIFDIFFIDNRGQPNELKYSDRMEYLDKISEIIKTNKLERIKIVETKKISTQDSLVKYYNQAIQDNYEGLIVKHNVKYSNADRKNMIKLKPAFRDEFKIVGFKDGIGKDMGLIIFICETTEETRTKAINYRNIKGLTSQIGTDYEFSVRPKQDDKWRADEFQKLSTIIYDPEELEKPMTCFEKNILGTYYTVEFQDYSEDLKPLRPVGIDYRDLIQGEVNY